MLVAERSGDAADAADAVDAADAADAGGISRSRRRDVTRCGGHPTRWTPWSFNDSSGSGGSGQAPVSAEISRKSAEGC